MRIRSALYLATLMLVLAACGRPEAINGSSSTQPPATPPTTRADIAQLLQKPPAPGTSVEIDAYVWRGWDGGEGSSWVDHDAQGCPILNSATILLTDKPTPWMLPVVSMRFSNSSPDYPPDSAPWLVISGNDPMPFPYHARLRGHLGDPSVATCSFAKHIFTVERVVTTYAQDNPDLGDMNVPDTFPNWIRYHDPDLGYSFLYPPDWKVEVVPGSGLVAELAVRNPQNPAYPILLRIRNGETYYDQYDTAHTPPLLQAGEGTGVFFQDMIPINGQVNRQHLVGYNIRYTPPDRHSQQTGVLFNSAGRSYELLLRYPIGLDASRDLTITYTFVVLSFQFDVPPGPTPTPPIKQALGTGPFLNNDQVLALARKHYGAEAVLLDSQLVSEAAARKNTDICSNFEGHPDGVWLFKIHGVVEDTPAIVQLFFDATTGSELCGEVTFDPDAPTPTPLTPVYPSPPAASPYPAP
jgi:hypothetical protein